MLFMVVERFRIQDAKSVYSRFHEKGRLMPGELKFVGSWVSADLGRCFLIMECDEITAIQKWVAEWSDLIEFEIVPVVTGEQVAEALRAQMPHAP